MIVSNSGHSQGFKDEDLRNCPGWCTVAIYCPSRPSLITQKNITKHGEREDENRCRVDILNQSRTSFSKNLPSTMEISSMTRWRHFFHASSTALRRRTISTHCCSGASPPPTPANEWRVTPPIWIVVQWCSEISRQQCQCLNLLQISNCAKVLHRRQQSASIAR